MPGPASIKSATGVNQSDGPGGGICNEATLSVTVGTLVTSNEAKAGGGGIYNDGSLTLRNSVVGLNQALDPDNDSDGTGGGIYGVAGSTATVTQSAIVENDAATAGGGVLMDGQLLMFNSTVSDNFSLLTGGIVITENGSANLVNVTVSENEGTTLTGQGVHVLEGSLAMGNTIVSAMDQASASCTNVSGTVTSLGHNLGDDDTCFGDASDIINADPLLGELDAIARIPLPGSPAVNAADPVLCSETAVGSVDQLDQPRPAFSGCDIGAIEWQGLLLHLPVILSQLQPVTGRRATIFGDGPGGSSPKQV